MSWLEECVKRRKKKKILLFSASNLFLLQNRFGGLSTAEEGQFCEDCQCAILATFGSYTGFTYT